MCFSMLSKCSFLFIISTLSSAFQQPLGNCFSRAVHICTDPIHMAPSHCIQSWDRDEQCFVPCSMQHNLEVIKRDVCFYNYHYCTHVGTHIHSKNELHIVVNLYNIQTSLHNKRYKKLYSFDNNIICALNGCIGFITISGKWKMIAVLGMHK